MPAVHNPLACAKSATGAWSGIGLRYPDLFFDKFSEGLLGDLAGDAFAATCCLAVMLAILTGMEFETTSETENNDDIAALLGMNTS
ncbi:unnamed protein product [Polarella glacialis]|uniref:Uncharacterized protein n=1 Tax=Polarella glacialis TaxID=89957 RepID=A0A813L572_POLGL|nr:unnamed protein product [Polarella glacialis]